MLKTNIEDINKDNIFYKRMIKDFLFLEEEEKMIDPRL